MIVLLQLISIFFWVAVGIVLMIGLLYVGHTWWQVGGLRGMALLLLTASLIVKAFTTAQLYSCTEYVDQGALIFFDCDTFIPLSWMIYARYTVDVLKSICVLLLIDLYRSANNSHRAWTTRAYVWFQEVTAADRRRKAQYWERKESRT